jgi:hypothetical protein
MVLLQPLHGRWPPGVLRQPRLQPARRFAKPGGDGLKGLMVEVGDHGGLRKLCK